MAVGVLEHGVPAAQGGQRRERRGPRRVVAYVVTRPGRAGAAGCGGPGPAAGRARRAGASMQGAGVGHRRPGADRGRASPARGRASRRTDARSRSRAIATRAVSSATSGTTRLAASVGRGGADVGDEVEQRRVRLVADRARPPACGTRRPPGSAASSENGSRSSTRAAAAGDHDHVDLGSRVQPPQRLDHLGHRGRGPASRRAATRNRDRRPAPPGVLEHVALGVPSRGRRPARRRRAGTAAAACSSSGEQPLGGEQLPAALEPGQQLAEPDRAGSRGAAARACRGWRRTTAWRAPRPWRPRRTGGLSAVEERARSR